MADKEQKVSTLKDNFRLEVAQKSEDMPFLGSSLFCFRYLGMPSDNRFAMEFTPNDSAKRTFTAYYPKNATEFKYSGKASAGKTEYVFKVKKVDEREIVFSEIEQITFGDYSSSGSLE